MLSLRTAQRRLRRATNHALASVEPAISVRHSGKPSSATARALLALTPNRQRYAARHRGHLGRSTPRQANAVVSQEPNKARSARVVSDVARGFMHQAVALCAGEAGVTSLSRLSAAMDRP